MCGRRAVYIYGTTYLLFIGRSMGSLRFDPYDPWRVVVWWCGYVSKALAAEVGRGSVLRPLGQYVVKEGRCLLPVAVLECGQRRFILRAAVLQVADKHAARAPNLIDGEGGEHAVGNE